MATHTSPQVEALWDRFHEVVNMTSRELREWLGVEPDLTPQPGPSGPAPLGLAVLSILGKRRSDLTGDDLIVMQKVIDVVEEETSAQPREELSTDERRRHRLMNVGHDPLRPQQEE
ncbi:DUF3140 domain-containing protein [Actinobacteria bacterium YIM 96077]|uniref:DUF3140 domain-containing protein n=1 Tax=Phytoactinopolyspora halophila TaxID=1981511 RepID=A0A329QTN1_9ACTN|nr:DUF3140 domain-containing protein [Phytoactinopolyspora halophila]AYY14546.1 DUF3140 domain-containing protein [Actinobacteria bacterium YIM 96077]RAW14078.1 hypothetical protein DPM12_11685 [Phytoactinopolyspora halophila]